MSNIIDILIRDFLNPAIFAIIGIVLFNLYTKIRKRLNPLRQILDLKIWEVHLFPPRRKKKDIWVTYGLIPPSELTISHYTVEEGDTRSLFTLISFLGEVYGRESVKVQNHEDIRSRLPNVDNLVSLSGPVYNKVTNHYLGRCGSPVKFKKSGGSTHLHAEQYNSQEDKKFYTEFDEEGRPEKCYGIVLFAEVKIEGKEQNVVILGGCSTLSTYGSVLLLSSVYNDNKIQSQLKQHNLKNQSKWLILFSVENWGQTSSDHSHVAPFKRVDINLSIERVYEETQFSQPYQHEM